MPVLGVNVEEVFEVMSRRLAEEVDKFNKLHDLSSKEIRLEENEEGYQLIINIPKGKDVPVQDLEEVLLGVLIALNSFAGEPVGEVK